MNASRLKKISTGLFALCTLFALFMFLETSAQSNTTQSLEFNKLSETFLAKARDHKNTQEIQNQLANTSLEILANSLNTDEKKLAF